jgi:hypothetical protein
MAKKGGLTKREVRDIIGRLTNEGEDIILFMVNVMLGRNPRASVTAQLQAGEWLGSYFFGRPVETTVQVSMTKKAADGPLTDITDEQLEELIRAGQLTETRAPRLPGGSLHDAGGGNLPDAALGLLEVQEGVVAGGGDAGGDTPAGGADGGAVDVEDGPEDG